MNKNEVGRAGEAIAAQYLTDHGYQILDANWRAAKGSRRDSGERQNRGELDLVAIQGATLVGVEVKTRSSTRYGHPASAITPVKIARLRHLLGLWLSEHRGKVPRFTEIRLDAIAIVLPNNLTHYQGINS